MKKIFATLDFSRFCTMPVQTLRKLLELSSVEKWDGSTLGEREQKITQAQLIKASECIAPLLYNLSPNGLIKHVHT